MAHFVRHDSFDNIKISTGFLPAVEIYPVFALEFRPQGGYFTQRRKGAKREGHEALCVVFV